MIMTAELEAEEGCLEPCKLLHHWHRICPSAAPSHWWLQEAGLVPGNCDYAPAHQLFHSASQGAYQ